MLVLCSSQFTYHNAIDRPLIETAVAPTGQKRLFASVIAGEEGKKLHQSTANVELK